jgi:hypothetical protein
MGGYRQPSTHPGPRRPTWKPGLGSDVAARHLREMSRVSIDLPESLDAAISKRLEASGAHSKEEYLLRLVESDYAAAELEDVLTERMRGPFAPLEPDWKERVQRLAAKNREG